MHSLKIEDINDTKQGNHYNMNTWNNMLIKPNITLRVCTTAIFVTVDLYTVLQT
jgi:hypothetical protein